MRDARHPSGITFRKTAAGIGVCADFPTSIQSLIGREIPIKPQQVWQRPFVAAEHARIRGELSELAATEGPSTALRAALSHADRPAASLEGQLHRFLYACAALDLHASGGGLDSTEAQRMARVASAMLERNRIRPGTSRLAHLHGELHAFLCRIAEREGRAWTAAWRHIVARTDGRLEDAGDGDLFRRVSLELQLGLAKNALERLLEAELADAPTSALLKLRIARVRILRLSGDLDAAAQALTGARGLLGPRRGPSPDDLRWEEACVLALRLASLEPVAQLLRAERSVRTPRRMLEFYFWSRAVRTRAFERVLPKASTLRRAASEALDPTALRCALALERCYAGHGSVGVRAQALGRVLERADSISEVDLQLVVWAAAGRWLLRVRRPTLAALPLARYRALSLGLSAGESVDVLRLVEDVHIALEPLPSFEDFALTDAGALPPTTALRRSLGLSRSAVVLLGRSVAHVLRSAGTAGTTDEGASAHLTELGEIAADTLGRLKGPIMKVGQLLSFYGFQIPDEVAQAFASLQDRAPPIDADHVIGVIERELREKVDHLFTHFEAKPLATGSIGQVHRAELPDGRRVAVKVQYPGIDKALQIDLAGLRLARPFLKMLLPEWDIEGILQELAERVVDECDYRREAEAQSAFVRLLSHEPHLCVPVPLLDLTTTRVLVSELVEGETFERFCERASQAERDLAGVAVMRYVIKTVSVDGAFNTDLHPGNLLFTPGRVHFLDFGSVRQAENGATRGFPRVVSAMLASDPAALYLAFQELGFVPDDVPGDAQRLFDRFSEGALACLREDRVSRFDLKTAQRDIALLAGLARSGGFRLPPRHLYFFRVYWGMFAVLARLGAAANWRRLAQEALASLGHGFNGPGSTRP